MNGGEKFRVVTRRRNKFKDSYGIGGYAEERAKARKRLESEIDGVSVVRQVLNAVDEIKTTGYFDILAEGLDEGLSTIGAQSLPELVCYGLGNFSQTKAAKYQLAAILAIKSYYSCEVSLYDPEFFRIEVAILETLGLKPLEINDEAKRKVGDRAILVYMPHCPYQLTNNFIYANWSVEQLSKSIILSNSFGDLVDSLYVRNLVASSNYLERIHPYVTEIELDNKFPYDHVFNGSAVHIFSPKNLSRVPLDNWEDHDEPVYPDGCEFIRQSQTKPKSSKKT